MSQTTRSFLLVVCSLLGVGLAVCIVASLEQTQSQIDSNGSYLAKQSEKSITSLPNIPTIAAAPVTEFAPAVTQETTIAPVKPEGSHNDAEKWISQLIEVVKMQATTPGTTSVKQESEAPPPPEPTLPPVKNEPASTETTQQPVTQQQEALPEPLGTTDKHTQIERNPGDHRLRLTLQESDIRNVLELLSQQGDLNILASKNVTGLVTANMTNVSVETALQSLLRITGFVSRREGNFIYVGTPEDFASLDKSFDQINTRVYRPNYVTSADVALLLTPLLSPETGKITVSTPAMVDVASSQTQAGGNSLTQTDVVVVRDYERVLMQLDELVREIDIRPRQVMIDTMVMSVKLNDQNKLGVDFQALKQQSNLKLGTNSPPASLGSVNFTEGGLKLGFLDSNLTSLISALETVGETNVIASPRLLCLNKQRAEIQIGEQLGYVSTTVTETSSTQAVQFLDVGTLLRIRPYISSDDTIRLDIHPELSTGSVTVSSGLTLPNKEVTQVTTNVMCNNGSTVIIGGLIREDLSNDTSQVPILGSIPVAGFLFRKNTAKVDRREILVLITPRLMDEPELTEEAVHYGNEFLRRQDINFEKMNPHARRVQGWRYYQLAKAAQCADDAQTALKYANLAIHYDPMNREAIALRDQVVATAAPNESVNEYLKQGLGWRDRPSIDYTKQGAAWKEGPALSLEQPASTYTPGQPGKILTIPPPPSP
jgi:type IV pilus assembly protein PilQ